MNETREYNPLDYANLTKSCVEELMRRTAQPLPIRPVFSGAGIYALFYTGNLPLYAPVRSPSADCPIYVGKAVPAGARKGLAKPTHARSLFHRINQHTKSIEATKSLRAGDFLCRYLVVTPLWITMAERFLLEHYRPIWNVVLDGFGNHDPGKRRYEGEITWWDALHPGRAWARQLQPTRDAAMAKRRLVEFFEGKRAAEMPAEDDEAREQETIEE
ncbi:MAG: hypothetical protein QOI24_3753 [Acidobacteriota bacterium]|jgi:hypothetical protein|nr:hypothetical protein [Acidobacteriota bacterium]